MDIVNPTYISMITFVQKALDPHLIPDQLFFTGTFGEQFEILM